MKLAFLVTAVLAVPLMVAAQTNDAHAPRTNPQSTPPAITAPGFPFPGGFKPPAGFLDQFWDDPAITAELHLTDLQRKQLQDAALTQQLALIDGGADALKAVAHLSAILQADQLDDPAYKQQLNNLAAASGKIVQDLGEMVVSPRRILTAEQWKKLQILKREKRVAVHSAAPSHQSPPRSLTVPMGDR
jgi:Spy/CpxP family protein refolding chaperone